MSLNNQEEFSFSKLKLFKVVFSRTKQYPKWEIRKDLSLNWKILNQLNF